MTAIVAATSADHGLVPREAAPAALAAPPPIDIDALALDVRWLIRMRWVAVIAVAASLAAGGALGWLSGLTGPLVVIGGLGAMNGWWHWRARAEGLEVLQRGAAFWRRRVVGQILVDLLALTLILHWTGGIENPFSTFYVFPVAIATMLLPLRHAVLVFGLAFALFLGLIACGLCTEHRHYPFAPFAGTDTAASHDAIVRHPVYLTGVAVARFVTLLGTVAFLSMLLTRLRRTEARRRRHEHIALARERLARVGALSAGLSHSIRNPLHGALNCISLLRDPTTDEERTQTINLLEEGLLRIETVTQRLMDMTREAPFSPQPTELREWIEELLQPFRLRSYEGKRVAIATDFQDVPPVVMDRHRIYDSLFNVIANAIDALPAAAGRITVATAPIREPWPGVEITVTDNGHGIATGDLGHVFEPFFTTKPIGEGTGLGLSIARQEIERHGGEIRIGPGPEGGTRVTIRLPSTPFEG